MAPNCSAILYNINASDVCGECPANTTLTTATCNEVQLISDVQVCNFSIQTNVCHEIASNDSGSLNFILPGIYTSLANRPVDRMKVILNCAQLQNLQKSRFIQSTSRAQLL